MVFGLTFFENIYCIYQARYNIRAIRKIMAKKPTDILSTSMLLDTFIYFEKQWLKTYYIYVYPKHRTKKHSRETLNA